MEQLIQAGSLRDLQDWFAANPATHFTKHDAATAVEGDMKAWLQRQLTKQAFDDRSVRT